VTRAETELELLGEGREAETLAWGEHRVLRLLKDPTRIDRLERELVALTAARRGGAPVPAYTDARQSTVAQASSSSEFPVRTC
jgi:hypothetical protein